MTTIGATQVSKEELTENGAERNGIGGCRVNCCACVEERAGGVFEVDETEEGGDEVEKDKVVSVLNETR